MPRLARTVVAGCAHHITEGGNNGQDVFFVDDDRRVYLEMLTEQAGSDLLNLRNGYRRISAEQWRTDLAEGLTPVEMDRLRLCPHTGRPRKTTPQADSE